MIRTDEWKLKKLEAIAEESGFGNRNTFALAFRKIKGQTPSDFMKLYKRNAPILRELDIKKEEV